MVSSEDMDHRGDNVIDPDGSTFWISTGLYPQEILLCLGEPSKVSVVKLAATNIKSVRIEGCQGDTAMSFNVLAESVLEDAQGHLQLKELACAGGGETIEYIRVVILSGWFDFCTVHNVRVEGEITMRRPTVKRKSLNKVGQPLEVAIPEDHMAVQAQSLEPYAPRVPSETSPWAR